jgi:tRNA(adenine34) deaminase
MFTDSEVKKYLEITLTEAKIAESGGNYPIGSLIVNAKGEILVQTHNECTAQSDISAHAEILCIRMLKNKMNKDYPEELTLFSSLEPCFGCSFFLARTNIKTIISALEDPHKGGISILKNLPEFGHFFKSIEIINEPVDELKSQSMTLMKNYFLRLNRPDAAKYYGYSESRSE